MSKANVPLSEAIKGLRNELVKAQKHAGEDGVHLTINHIEVELETSIVKTFKINAEAKGGVESDGFLQFFIGKFNAEAKLETGFEYQDLGSQKIMLNLSVTKEIEGAEGVKSKAPLEVSTVSTRE